MPAGFHIQAVPYSAPVSLAVSGMPPRASITSAVVVSSRSMNEDCIKASLISKGQNEIDGLKFYWMASCGGMDDLTGDSKQAIARRLAALPGLCGFASDAAFAAHIGVSAQRYNTAKKTGNLSNDLQAILVRKVAGMTYEWLKSGRAPAYFGHNETTSARARPSRR